jgi:hypothetical protein
MVSADELCVTQAIKVFVVRNEPFPCQHHCVPTDTVALCGDVLLCFYLSYKQISHSIICRLVPQACFLYPSYLDTSSQMTPTDNVKGNTKNPIRYVNYNGAKGPQFLVEMRQVEKV